ncbi:MAG TPA: hypothetical protein VIK89_00775 [Cytophagaceae bacterium]
MNLFKTFAFAQLFVLLVVTQNSFAQSDTIKVDGPVYFVPDLTEWKKSGNFSFQHNSIPDLFFSIQKAVLSPGQKGLSTDEFIVHSLNTIRRAGYEDLTVSEVRDHGSFKYFIFSYNQNLKRDRVYSILSSHKEFKDIQIIVGGKNMSEEVLIDYFTKIEQRVIQK